MTIKLLKKGIKFDGKYYPCRYSSSKNNLKGNATIYFKGYEPLPSEAYELFSVENNTDMMTDSFERDRIRVAPGSKYFNDVEALSV